VESVIAGIVLGILTMIVLRLRRSSASPSRRRILS
jgi:hypothetical protein